MSGLLSEYLMDDCFVHHQQMLERGFKDMSTSGHKKDLIKAKHKPIERDEGESHPNFECRCRDGAMENATLLSKD